MLTFPAVTAIVLGFGTVGALLSAVSGKLRICSAVGGKTADKIPYLPHRHISDIFGGNAPVKRVKLKISLVFSAGKPHLVRSFDLLSACRVAIGVFLLFGTGFYLGENFFGLFFVVSDNSYREDLVLGKLLLYGVVRHNLLDSLCYFHIFYVKLSFQLLTVVIVALDGNNTVKSVDAQLD